MTDSASTTANHRALRAMGLGAPGDGRRRIQRSPAIEPRYTRLTGEEVDALPGDMVRLDEPSLDTATARGTEGAWTARARVGQRLVGVASVSRQQPPGPPMRGVYRIHGVAVRAADRGQGHETALIERCIGYAAANRGRTLWCRVPLDTVDVWRQCGFAIAGPPLATGNTTGGTSAWALMMRRLAPGDAGLG